MYVYIAWKINRRVCDRTDEDFLMRDYCCEGLRGILMVLFFFSFDAVRGKNAFCAMVIYVLPFLFNIKIERTEY